MEPQSKSWLRNEAGQAAALIALLLFFAFLPLAALAIDGSIVFLVRRDLQNVADASTLAACSDLANGGSEYTALVTATNTIATNLGSFAPFVGLNPGLEPNTLSGGASTNIGSGTSLIKGIEVITAEVRTALQRPAPTVLTQFVGRGTTPVTAQARCSPTAGGGLMPIAVQRYDGGDTYRDYLANQTASGPGVSSAPGNASGPPPAIPYPSDCETITVAGHYGSFQVPVPVDYPVSVDNPGPQVPLLGQKATTNNTAGAMSGFVMLDVRNIAAGLAAMEFYNGVTNQVQPYKNVSQGWILQHGYPGPYPDAGSEIAILNGVSASFGPQAITDAGYKVGDVIATIVYDGFVWETPDFAVTVTPKDTNPNGIMSAYPTATNPVTYTISIQRAGSANAQWWNPHNFVLTFNFSSTVPAGTHVLIDGVELAGLTTNVSNVFEASGWTGALSIYSDSAGPWPITQTTKFLGGFSAVAYDSTTGVSHAGPSNYGFGSIGSDYALRPDSSALAVNQGDSVSAYLSAFGTNYSAPANKCRGMPVSAQLVGTTYTWSQLFSSNSNNGAIDIAKSGTSSSNFSLTADPNAATGDYTLRFTVTPDNQCGLPQHSVDIPIKINAALASNASATPKKFVIIQGYSLFKITYIDSNDVLGQAIHPLAFKWSDITVGLRPRLVPWN